MAEPLEQAFGTLSDDLRHYASRRLAPEDVEDVVQDAILALWEARTGDLHVRDRRAWAFGVARNRIARVHRGAARERPGIEPVKAEEIADDPVEDDSLLRLGLSRWLAAAIDELDEPYRSTLRATELDRTPYATLAAVEGVSVSAIKSRVVRGREQLRQRLVRCCDVQLDARNSPMDLQAHGACTGC